MSKDSKHTVGRFWAWWLRKIVKNEVGPSILYLLLFRGKVNAHFEKMLYLRRNHETGLMYKVKERARDE